MKIILKTIIGDNNIGDPVFLLTFPRSYLFTERQTATGRYSLSRKIYFIRDLFISSKRCCIVLHVLCHYGGNIY